MPENVHVQFVETENYGRVFAIMRESGVILAVVRKSGEVQIDSSVTAGELAGILSGLLNYIYENWPHGDDRRLTISSDFLGYLGEN